MTKRSTKHETFTIERDYPAPPARVFAAWAEPKSKARWFVGPDAWEKTNHALDFRVGGEETVSGRPPGGPLHSYRAWYCDIVPNERIVSTYEMRADDVRTSVSLATVELAPHGAGTRLRYTEQAVFLDGHDSGASREAGTRDLLENLARSLRG